MVSCIGIAVSGVLGSWNQPGGAEIIHGYIISAQVWGNAGHGTVSWRIKRSLCCGVSGIMLQGIERALPVSAQPKGIPMGPN